ncbi:glutamine-rich protein 2-like isoform X3 [Caloenas nicobarica]|uniref:glutamine-rich protein 2-like isoform X3 n=1 Tax=Caloenas nicobarica TaxID=187106 RepID=UPI0032B8593C
MDPLSLLEMLKDTFLTPQVGAVSVVKLQKLLEAMIIGQQRQQEKDQDTKEKPGQEEEEKDMSKDRASLQDLWEEINKFKEVQSSLAEDMRAMQEAMQERHSGLAKNIQAMQEAMQEAHSSMAKDIQAIQETLGLEGSGGQSAPTEPTHVDMDTQSRKSSALGPKGRGTQPGMETSSGTPGSGSPGMQAGTQGEPVTPVKLSGAPSDHTGSHDASASTPGMQPGSPGTQASTSGLEPGPLGTQASTPLGTQPGSPGTQASTLGLEPGPLGTQASTPLGTQPGSPGTQASTLGLEPGPLGTQASTPLGTQPGSPGTQASTPLGTQPEAPGTQASTPLGTQPGAPGTQASTSGLEPGSPGTHTTTPRMQPGSPGSQANIPGDAREPAVPWGSLGSTSTSGHEAEMREALSQVGQLGHLCAALKEQVEQLKETKAERAELENLHRLFPEGGQESITSILANLQCQMSFLQDMARNLKEEEEEKIRKVEDAPRKMRGAGAGRKADGSGQMTQQLRPKRQKVKAERKELVKQQEPSQAELEQFAAEYVNKLVTETAKKLQAEVQAEVQAEQQDEPRATAQSGGQEQAGCPEHAGCLVCNVDTRLQLGKFLQRCEKLEEQVESLSQKAGSKMENYPKWRRQSLQQDEQLKRVQASMAQLQKDYEKFSSALANLLHDRQQDQNNIKALFQALERLKKQKADKEELLLLGINEKADKAALADKVSRSQFEASVERLNKMVEEVTSRVTGQEQEWHLFQQQLQTEMDSKLERRELGLFRKQLEERWKSLRGQLQEKAPQPERDDAAGIRKQLLAGFHCLSCDRPLNMLAPGPERPGECRYPTVPRSCGGPHTLTPPRFQPQPPSTPRRLPPVARRPNKDAMQLSGQDGADGNRQDEQLSMMGGSQLSSRQTGTPDTTASRSLPSTPSSLRHRLEHRPASSLQHLLEHRPASSPGRLTLAPKLLPPVQPPRSESTP